MPLQALTTGGAARDAGGRKDGSRKDTVSTMGLELERTSWPKSPSL